MTFGNLTGLLGARQVIKIPGVAGKETEGNGGWAYREMERAGPPRGIQTQFFLNSLPATLSGAGFNRLWFLIKRKRGVGGGNEGNCN